jgi:hypothetical protein
MKLTPFVAMVIAMIFTFIVAVVVIVHIDLRITSLEKRMELRENRGYVHPGDVQRGKVIL